MCRQWKKNLLNTNISSTYPHNIVNFGPLTAMIGCWVSGTPANFNGFRVLASLLHQCRSTEVIQTLHDVWPSPGTGHHLYSARRPSCCGFICLIIPLLHRETGGCALSLPSQLSLSRIIILLSSPSLLVVVSQRCAVSRKQTQACSAFCLLAL